VIRAASQLPSVIVLEVIGNSIGIGYKSDLLLVEGTINAYRYIQNMDQLEMIDAVDHKHGSFVWIFEQDGAPSCTSQIAMD
jgi:hypothetical protein